MPPVKRRVPIPPMPRSTAFTGYAGRTILVTGGDGFIGSHLVEALAATGARVKALCYYESFGRNGWLDDIPPATLKTIEVVRGDIRDAGFVHRLVAGQDMVFHLAALIGIPYSYQAPLSYVQTNIEGTLNLLEAAHAHGVMRFVHTSTSEVYGSAQTLPITERHPLVGQSPYSASKIGADMMAESYFRSFGMPVAILRPFNTFGPRQSERAVIPTVIRQALDPACEVIEVGAITPSRDFTYVADTVGAFLAIGLSDTLRFGTPYNAGTGQDYTIGQMIDLVLKVTGSNKPLVNDDERVRPEASEVRALLADHARLTEATGWEPLLTFEEGLKLTVDWWRKRIEAGRQRKTTGYLV